MAAAAAAAVLAGCGSTNVSGNPPAAVGASSGVHGDTPAGASLPVPPVVSRPSGEPPGRDDHDADASSAPKAAASPVVLAFARAWVRRERTPQQWLDAVRPLCEPGFATLMATVDPGNVPASRVTSAPVAVAGPAGGSARYRVATDAGTLSVTVTSVRGRWLVSGNDFTARP